MLPENEQLHEDTAGPERVAVRRLQLADFRNYRQIALAFEPGAVVLVGENGAGKTNMLEAISFLSPGRGLRRARLAEVVRAGAPDGFALHARLEGPFGEVEIGTGTHAAGEDQAERARRVRINGANQRSADALLEWIRLIWITPAMDGLFTGPAADRRRFLDRLVLAIDAGHGRRAADYEKAMRSRNRLLEEGSSNHAWFEAIENQMAETGVAMAAARCEMVRLLAAGAAQIHGAFPAATLALSGMLEERIGAEPAVTVEEDFRLMLAENRARDRAAGRTLDGPHRTDLLVGHAGKSMPAALSSTGEQKALLVGIILAHARLTARLTGMTPVLLLDEIAAHLDGERRHGLFSMLAELNCQVFATGTDRALFAGLPGKVQILTVKDGQVDSAQTG